MHLELIICANILTAGLFYVVSDSPYPNISFHNNENTKQMKRSLASSAKQDNRTVS